MATNKIVLKSCPQCHGDDVCEIERSDGTAMWMCNDCDWRDGYNGWVSIHQLMTANEFHVWDKRTGKCAVYKRTSATRIGKNGHAFEVPVKRGLREFGTITMLNWAIVHMPGTHKSCQLEA